MTLLILVSAAEKYEQPVELALVSLQQPLARPDAGLTPEQMQKLLERVHPALLRSRLDFPNLDKLQLRYLVDGEPVLDESWTSEATLVAHSQSENVVGFGPYKFFRTAFKPALEKLAL